MSTCVDVQIDKYRFILHFIHDKIIQKSYNYFKELRIAKK